MKKLNRMLLVAFLGMFFCNVVAWCSDTMTAAPVRIDTRTSQGVQIITGTEWVSAAANSANPSSSSLTVDGASASGWSKSNPYYDSTQKADGWHTFRLMENGSATSKSLLVLNDGVVVHGGALTSNAGFWYTSRNFAACRAGLGTCAGGDDADHHG